MKYLWSINNFS